MWDEENTESSKAPARSWNEGHHLQRRRLPVSLRRCFTKSPSNHATARPLPAFGSDVENLISPGVGYVCLACQAMFRRLQEEHGGSDWHMESIETGEFSKYVQVVISLLKILPDVYVVASNLASPKVLYQTRLSLVESWRCLAQKLLHRTWSDENC